MKKNVFLAGLSLLAISACHRPYALYQPTSQPRPGMTLVPDRPLRVQTPTDTLPGPARLPMEPALASLKTGLSEADMNRLPARHQHVTRWSTESYSPSEIVRAEPGQPKPRPRAAAPSHKKSLREMLGLKPRPTLNWWQKIPWQLKASGVVILLAVLFAILGITILAIVFGLIGAFLLVRGLKKSFKVRRPWF